MFRELRKDTGLVVKRFQCFCHLLSTTAKRMKKCPHPPEEPCLPARFASGACSGLLHTCQLEQVLRVKQQCSCVSLCLRFGDGTGGSGPLPGWQTKFMAKAKKKDWSTSAVVSGFPVPLESTRKSTTFRVVSSQS